MYLNANQTNQREVPRGSSTAAIAYTLFDARAKLDMSWVCCCCCNVSVYSLEIFDTAMNAYNFYEYLSNMYTMTNYDLSYLYKYFQRTGRRAYSI